MVASTHPEGTPYPYVVVSANTSDTPTSFADVPGQLLSPGHKRLQHQTPGGEDALGVWTDGAEASRFVPHADLNDGARWGLSHNQKAILHWHPDNVPLQWTHPAAEGKPAHEYMTTVNLPPHEAAKRFNAEGVSYLTIIPRGNGVASEVRCIDEGGALEQAFRKAAAGAKVAVTPGVATFLGDWDDRAKGAKVFHAVLGKEEEEPAKLSRPGDTYVIHHFTTRTSAPTVKLDPNHGPPNSWTSADLKAWNLRRLFFYLDPKQREGFFRSGGERHYIAETPKEGIYDADENPLESMAALFDLPRTHRGVKWDNTIQLFHPIEARLATPEETAKHLG